MYILKINYKPCHPEWLEIGSYKKVKKNCIAELNSYHIVAKSLAVRAPF